MPELSCFLFARLNRVGDLALLPSMLLCVAAAPLVQNNSETLKVEAGQVELLDKTQKAIFTGNVQVEKTDIRITANAATVSYSGRFLAGASSPEIKRIVANGNVVFTRPQGAARGNWAIYDLGRRYVILIGNVSLERPTGLVRGGRLTINLDTNLAVMNSSSVNAPADSGPTGNASVTATRVTGTFTVRSGKDGMPR